MGVTRKVKRRQEVKLALFGGSGSSSVMESPAHRMLVAAALALSPLPEMQTFSQDLRDPSGIGISFVRLMEKHRLTVTQVEKAYTEVKNSEGLIQVASHIPAIMEQVAIDAQSQDLDCMDCAATGKVPEKDLRGRPTGETVICKPCRGTGQVRVLGDTRRLELALQMTGLITKSGGNQTVSVDLSNTTTSEKLEELAETLSGLHLGPRKPAVIEGSVE